jgi:hypothetical protein
MTEQTVADEQLGRLARKQNDLFRRVREGTLDPESVLRALQRIIEGNFNGTGGTHIIDCDAAPLVPEGWKVEEHKKGGLIDLTKTTLMTFLTEGQKKGTVAGNTLRKELADKPVLNANVLDYLLANPELIPSDWKGKAVFFWGTVYRVRDGRLCVRCLYWLGGRWRWGCVWLGRDWDSSSPALVVAS